MGKKYNGDVVLEDFNKEKPKQQLWYKGEPNAEGYFILENDPEIFQVPKVMTAISPSNIKVKGKTTLR